MEHSSNGGQRRDKSAHISTTSKVSSAPKSYVWSVHGSDHDHRGWYSQNRIRKWDVNSHRTPGLVAGASHRQGKLTLQNGTPVLLSPRADSGLHPPARTLQLQGKLGSSQLVRTCIYVAVSFPADPERKKKIHPHKEAKI